jgi:hypothetical protein
VVSRNTLPVLARDIFGGLPDEIADQTVLQGYTYAFFLLQ